VIVIRARLQRNLNYFFPISSYLTQIHGEIPSRNATTISLANQRRTAWGVHGERRRPQAAHLVDGPPLKQPKAVSEVACPQGTDRLGMAGPSDTLGSPQPPLAIRP
jgi:hypothetical protein